MKVTAIKKQIKSAGRYSIYIDDKFSFGLSEMGLINSGIRIGLELNETQIENYKSDSDIDKIYTRMLDLVMRRPRSEWELRNYLKRKQQSQENIEKLLNMLSNNGFVNDYDFARRWVESRRLLKSSSKRKLQLELKQKRISDDIISQVLAEDETDEFEVLTQLVQKKRGQTRYQDNTKLMQYLARQGFRYDDITQALNANND